MPYFLVDPVIVIFFMLAALTWYAQRNAGRQIARFTALTLTVYVLLASPLLANSLTYLLESQVAAEPCTSRQATAIVVLGGGIRGNIANVDDTGGLKAASFRRTQAALKLASSQPRAMLILSGGAGQNGISEADLMSSLLTQQGIAADRLVKDSLSRNTWESSRNVASLVKKNQLNNIVLVTSAMHMPRALRVFREQGIDTCPFPVDRVLVVPAWYEFFIPQLSAMTKTKQAMHELLGLGWYYLSGKISF